MPLCQYRSYSRIILVCFVCLFLSQLTWAETKKHVDVDISGVDEAMADTLLNGLSIKRQQDSQRLSARSVKRLHDQAVDEIKHMLTVYGYYTPEVVAELTELLPDQWQVHYQISLGEPVLVRHLEVAVEGEAQHDPKFTRLIEGFPLKTGDHFDHQNYESAKKSVLRIAAERGYFDGDFVCSKVTVDVAEQAADVCLVYDAGQRYHFGVIHFPDTVVNESLLEAMVDVKPGEPFDS